MCGWVGGWVGIVYFRNLHVNLNLPTNFQLDWTRDSRVTVLRNGFAGWLLGIIGSLTTVTRVVVKDNVPPTRLPSFEMIGARLLG